MRNFKSLFNLVLILTSILFSSCIKDSNELVKSEEKHSKEEMISILKEYGIDMSDAVVKNSYFVIGGNLKIDFTTVSEIKKEIDLNHKNQLKGYIINNKMYYPSIYGIIDYLTISNIQVYIDPNITGQWLDGIKKAINDWNNISPYCSIHFMYASNAANANFTIMKDPSPTSTDPNNAAIATPTPYSKFSNPTILLNSQISQQTPSYYESIMVRALGFCLDFDYSDGILSYFNSSHFNKTQIQGTASSANADPQSAMSQTWHAWTGFTADDILSAKTVYPYAYTNPQASISGPGMGNNTSYYTWKTSVSGGMAPFTYSWEYSYDDETYRSLGKTTSSITQQLPNGLNLYLRVSVTDAKGTTVQASFYTGNITALQ